MIDAIILAGGKGTRLQSVVSDVPKPLAPVNGRPFLDYQLELLARSGRVRKAVLALGWLAQRVIAHYERNPPPLPVEYVLERRLLGTGGGLRNALDNTSSAHVLALNGDSVFRWDLAALFDAHASAGAASTLALVHVPDSSRYGVVEVNHGRVTAFREKESSAGPGLINAGLYLFERTTLQAITPGEVFSLERDLFPALAELGALAAAPYSSEFIDIGLPETYAAAASILPALAAPARLDGSGEVR